MKKVDTMEMRSIEGGAYLCLICKSKGINHISATKAGHVLHAVARHPGECAAIIVTGRTY